MAQRISTQIRKCTIQIMTALAICTLIPTDGQAAASAAIFDFTGVAKKAIPAVVSVQTKGKQKAPAFGGRDFEDDIWERFFGIPRPVGGAPTPPQMQMGQASGFLVDAAGHILTNAHVVRDSEEISVLLSDGREFQAKLIGQDPNTDVALLKIEGKDFPFLPLGDSSQAEVGQWVAAVGNPFGLQASLTAGVVSALSRTNLDLAALEDFIQTDAAINRGNSGGPLLNLNGEVIGMATALASNTGGYIGIGFAIPSNIAKYVMNQFLASGKVSRGFLGVVLQQITYDSAMALGLPKVEGALVAEVQDSSPASAAGLKRGDVILKYNNQSVETASGLRMAVSLLAPGTEITLTILRNKETLPVKVLVGSFPEGGDLQAGTGTPQAENLLGITVQELTPELAQKLGYAKEQGVVVSGVAPGSPANWVGLKSGSLVMEINQQPIASVRQFNSAIGELKRGSHVLLLVRQDQATRYIALTLR